MAEQMDGPEIKHSREFGDIAGMLEDREVVALRAARASLHQDQHAPSLDRPAANRHLGLKGGR
jgi:hypothetical protein